MNAPWRIEMLGWLRAVDNDRVVSRFRSRQTGALLAYLAYHQQRSHPRRQLEPPGVPAGAVLIADRASVQLCPQACLTDVARFEVAAQAARAGSKIEAVEALRHACDSHRGELLPGYFEPWNVPER